MNRSGTWGTKGDWRPRASTLRAAIVAKKSNKREALDSLPPEDHNGRVLVFHALRHTCGAWAAIGGASPKAIQTLMRHSKITLPLDA